MYKIFFLGCAVCGMLLVSNAQEISAKNAIEVFQNQKERKSNIETKNQDKQGDLIDAKQVIKDKEAKVSSIFNTPFNPRNLFSEDFNKKNKEISKLVGTLVNLGRKQSENVANGEKEIYLISDYPPSEQRINLNYFSKQKNKNPLWDMVVDAETGESVKDSNIVEYQYFDPNSRESIYAILRDIKVLDIYVGKHHTLWEGKQDKATHYRGTLHNNEFKWDIQGERDVVVPDNRPKLKLQKLEDQAIRAKQVNNLQRAKCVEIVTEEMNRPYYERLKLGVKDLYCSFKNVLCSFKDFILILCGKNKRLDEIRDWSKPCEWLIRELKKISESSL